MEKETEFLIADISSDLSIEDKYFLIYTNEKEIKIPYSDVNNIRVYSDTTVKSFYGKKKISISTKENIYVFLLFKKSFNETSKKDETSINKLGEFLEKCQEFGINIDINNAGVKTSFFVYACFAIVILFAAHLLYAVIFDQIAKHHLIPIPALLVLVVNSFGLIQDYRAGWVKFEPKSMRSQLKWRP